MNEFRNELQNTKLKDVMRLPSEMSYLGYCPAFSIVDEVVQCQFCDQKLILQALTQHIEQCCGNPVNKASDYRYKYKRPSTDIDLGDFENNDLENSLLCKYQSLGEKTSCINSHIGGGTKYFNGQTEKTQILIQYNTIRKETDSFCVGDPAIKPVKYEQSHVLSSTTPSNSGIPVSVVNTFAQSEVDTSSSNSSPISESDKNNVYDSCVSSSSSNSVNIVRLKHDKPKYRHKNNVISSPYLFGSSRKLNKPLQEAIYIKPQNVPSPPQHHMLSSQPLQKHILSSQPSKVLHVDTNSSAANLYSPADTLFECRPFFETVQPSTSVQESSSENGKSKLSLIIRRVPNQNPNDVRRVSIEKENSSRADNLRCFLVTEEDSRQQSVKTTKHQIKKKISENREIKPSDKRNEHSWSSEQQIAFLTGRIETLNKQIETLTGQVGPLRLENEEYKAEIRNLRSRVEELESSTNALIEQKNMRATSDKKIEELQQSWERERFHFTQHLEELQTELSDYKNSSSREKQKLTVLNALLERKFGLQTALTENLQKEKEILERHIPPTVHYQLVMNELSEIQRNRSVIYTLLSANLDCHISNSSTVTFPSNEQLPLNSRQVIDMNTYLPLETSSADRAGGNDRQLINVYKHSDNKIRYQTFSNEVPNNTELMNFKNEDNSDDGSAIS